MIEENEDLGETEDDEIEEEEDFILFLEEED